MDEREELTMLRRLAELEAKAGGAPAKQGALTPSPTDGNSFLENARIGLGKSFVDTYQGLKQLGASAGNKIGLVDDSTVAKIQGDVDEQARLDKPLMGTGGGVVGDITGQLVQMALPASKLGKVGAAPGVFSHLNKLGQVGNLVGKVVTNPITRAGAGGAAFAATQPVLDGDSRSTNMLLAGGAGAAGQGVVSGIAALAKPAVSALSPAVRELALKAEAMGIPVNAAQLSDSKFVQTLASTIEKMPFTGALKSRLGQQESFNRAVSKTFGEDAPAVTRDVYAAAKARIGGEFERLSGQNTLKVSDDLLNNLLAKQDEAAKFGNADTEKAVRAAVDELLSKADDAGNIPGKAYQSLDSKLGKLMKSGGEKSAYLGDIRNAVRTAMDDSISEADKAAWKTARGQYKNLKTIRDLVAKDGAKGDISPALLMGRINSSEAGKEAMAMGRGGEMADLARIGQQFIKDKVPDSGTAQRLLALGSLGGGSYALGVDPQTALLTLAGGATAGRGLNKLMQSQTARNYMLNGSAGTNRLAELLQPLPYVAAPAALNMSR